MKKITLKKGLSITICTVFLAFNSLPLTQAATFTDTSHSLYEEEIEALAELGIIEGYESGMYRPNSQINRAEFTKIIIEAN